MARNCALFDNCKTCLPGRIPATKTYGKMPTATSVVGSGQFATDSTGLAGCRKHPRLFRLLRAIE